MSIADNLQPSKLGTKEHWENVYEEELQNFEELGDEEDPSILEVGSGSGNLFALADARYTADTLLGIDYFEGAVALACSIAQIRSHEGIHFHRRDFLNVELPPYSDKHMADDGAWDLILDKGTFDTIALMQKDNQGEAPVDGYPVQLARLLKPGAYFVITSCNFTEAELQEKFVTPATGLHYYSHTQHQAYTFGGRSGNICSSVAVIKPVAG
ncbi:hypothetical protein EDC04DRAFT_2879841 [Pisolithus marmoratus]|nr:hypothetical protein EDC04DRAFT_2879841 [Pisolithus marmoratus]